MKVMVVGVHPDDETLSCGGTLLKGDDVYWLLITSMGEGYTDEQKVVQNSQVSTVEKAYPFNGFTWLKLPTTKLDSIGLDRVIEPIFRVVSSVRPGVIYIPWISDTHSDHRVIFNAMSTILKPFYMRKFGIKRVLACETITETDTSLTGNFSPNVFVDITDTLERKLEIFSLYKTEVQAEPYGRSLSALRSLARYRGSIIGVEYAEAFMLMREISGML